MKKILLLICTSLICLTSIFILDKDTIINADENYPISCKDQYELSKITNDGSFQKEACFVNFGDAKTKMNELGDDYVIRHHKSSSPSKIIAMTKGNRAYSYSARSHVYTMNFYEAPNLSTAGYKKRTYISGEHELFYAETVNYDGNGNGSVKVMINGFTGYCQLINLDLVPNKFFTSSLRFYRGSYIPDMGEMGIFSLVPKHSYYTVEQNGNYRDLVYYSYYGYEVKNQTRVEKYIIDTAPKELEVGKKYYSFNGFDFYSDIKLQNKVTTYYPYYQFLDARSKTNLNGNDLNSYFNKIKPSQTSVMRGLGEDFINVQNEYGVNGLLLFAMAAHESAWGTSKIALSKNNLFGWNAIDSDPNQASKFPSAAACVKEHAGINLRGYLNILDERYFGSILGNKGSGFNLMYASDPFWGMGISSIMYQTDKHANNYDGNLKDRNAYKMYIIHEFGAPVKNGPNDNAKTYYTANYGPTYQENFIVTPLEQVGEYTKIQFSNPIVDGNIVSGGKKLVKYDFNNSVAYVKTSYLTPLVANDEVQKPTEPEVTPPTKPEEKPNQLDGDNIISMDKVELNNGVLNLEGVAFVTNNNYTDQDKINHTLKVISLNDDKIVKEIKLETFDADIDLNDGYKYKYTGFKGSVDLSGLKNNSYTFKIQVNNGDMSKEFFLRSSKIKHQSIVDKVDKLTYYLSTNITYGLRFELDKTLNPLDFNSINIPSISPTIISIDKLKLEDKFLKHDGFGFISSTDFGKQDNTNFEWFLIKEDGTKIDLNAKKVETTEDYSELLDIKYRLDDISYSIDFNLSNLEKGVYDIYCVISNDTYKDIRFLIDRQNKTYDSIKIGDKLFKLVVSNDRFKVQLIVE